MQFNLSLYESMDFTAPHSTFRCPALNFIQIAHPKWKAQMQFHLHCDHHCTDLHKTHNTQIFEDMSCSKIIFTLDQNVENIGKI
jgi:hypothetical protein